MILLSSTWQLLARSVAHKQELMEYAISCGVPVAHPVTNHYDDKDCYLSYFGPGLGIGSLAKRHEFRITEVVTIREFTDACDAHQRSGVASIIPKFARTPVLE